VTILGRALAVLLALALMPLGVAQAKTAPARDWSKTFAVSSAGGFVMGNPKARVKLVEYGSLTCPHCRHFAQDAVKPLVSQYVRAGRVSWEFRPMVLNATDLGATLLARCAGPSRFFPIVEKLYATQPVWTARTEKVTQEQLNAIPDKEVGLKMAELAGIIPLAQASGIPPARARACLTDEAAQTRIAAIYQGAIDAGIPGTPYFLINGKQAPVWDWTSLQQELRKAGL
jgi:protein-disulfide isomerase